MAAQTAPDPRQMTRDELINVCYDAYSAAEPIWRRRHYSGARWVMSRPWYDSIRKATVTAEQERVRAKAHAELMIKVVAPWPRDCPGCGHGPFADLRALSEHVATMADPDNREPDDRDSLFGIRIKVREDGGMPHLEQSPQ